MRPCKEDSTVRHGDLESPEPPLGTPPHAAIAAGLRIRARTAAAALDQPAASPRYHLALGVQHRQVHARTPMPAFQRAAQLARSLGCRRQDLDRQLARKPLLEGRLARLGVPPPGNDHGEGEYRQTAENGQEDGERKATGHGAPGASCWRART
jgi:hypothetical protein